MKFSLISKCGVTYGAMGSLLNQIALPSRVLIKTFIVLQFLSIHLKAQYTESIYPFESITVEKGLPDHNVKCILQDQYGFMWFGTNSGLCRYDGYNFTVYTHNPEDSTSISNNRITCLYLDTKGRIWIGTQIGLNLYDGTSNNIRRFSANEVLQNEEISDITEDKAGKVWVATRSGKLFFSDKSQQVFSQMPTKLFQRPQDRPIIRSGILINRILVDQNNELWVATGGAGLFRIDTKTLMTKHYLHFSPSIEKNRPLALTNFRSMIIKNGCIYLGHYRGILKFDPNRETFTDVAIPKPFSWNVQENVLNVENYLQDAAGNIWFTINPSRAPINLAQINFDNLETHFYNTDPFSASNLNIQHILSIFEDRTGIFWLGIKEEGLIKFRPKYTFKSIYIPQSDTINNVPNVVLNIIESHDNNILIGTQTGLLKYDKSSGKLSEFVLPVEGKSQAFKSTINSLLADNAQQIWVGTPSGLYLFNQSKHKLTQYFPAPNNPVASNQHYVRTIYKDQQGKLWIGTGNGVFDFDPITRQYHFHTIPQGDTARHKNYLITKLFEDHAGFLWIGTWGHGLFRWNRQADIWKLFPETAAGSRLSSSRITAIIEDSQNKLWVGTDGAGVIHYDPHKDCFLPFEYNPLICSNRIIGLTEDQHGNLWIITDAGISRYKPTTGVVKNYTRIDGVTFYLGDNLSRARMPIFNNYTVTRDGWIYVGGRNGITYFHPDSLTKWTRNAPIYITNILIPNYKEYTFVDLLKVNHLVLKHTQNNLVIAYALLDFNQSGRIQYTHILENYDKQWSLRHAANTTIYSTLPPGHYLFRVKGINIEGSGTYNEAQIKITIKPPFWATWWFRIALIILAIAGILVGIKIRTSVIQNQKRLLEMEVAARTLELQEKSKALQIAHDTLEQKVAERTAQLAATNVALEREVKIRKNTEEALRASEQTARVLLNAPKDLAFLISTDGTILALNRALAERFNQPEEALIGKKVELFLEPQVVKLRAKKLHECIDTKQIVHWEDVSRGTHYDNYFYPIFDADGNVSTVAVYARDITEQKRVENFLRNAQATLEVEVKKRTHELKAANEQLKREIQFRKATETRLRASEQRFRDLFQNSNDPIWTTNENGDLLSINKNFIELTKYSKKEILQMNPLNLISTEQRFKVLLNFQRVRHGKSANFECDIITKTGEVRNMWLKVRPITDNGKIIGVHGIGRDITELKAALRELQVSEEAKRQSLRQFTLQLAHEIKNPLATIKSSAQLVADSAIGSADHNIRRHMNTITTNVALCNQVIQELYAYTHPHGLHFNQVPATQFCHSLHERVRSRLEYLNHIKAKWTIPDDLPFINIDEERLLVAFQNLYFNAIEAIGNKGKISFKARVNKREQQVEFILIDTGVGIPPDKLSKIFEPFFSTKARGFGIGLPVAKETIEAHGGAINVTSSLNKGTTFTIKLPIAAINNKSNKET